MSDHTALLARLEQRAIELDEFPFDAYQDTAALLREAIAALAPAKCALCGGLNPTHCNRCYGNVAYMTTPPADRGAAAPAPEDVGPHTHCPRCNGTGEEPNAQFRCPCRWEGHPLRAKGELLAEIARQHRAESEAADRGAAAQRPFPAYENQQEMRHYEAMYGVPAPLGMAKEAAPAPEGLAGLKKRDRLIARLEDMADDCAQGQRTSKTDRWRLTLVQAAAALRARSALSDEVLDDLVGWIRMSSKDEDGHHIYDLTVGEASDLVRAVLARQQEQGR